MRRASLHNLLDQNFNHIWASNGKQWLSVCARKEYENLSNKLCPNLYHFNNYEGSLSQQSRVNSVVVDIIISSINEITIIKSKAAYNSILFKDTWTNFWNNGLVKRDIKGYTIMSKDKTFLLLWNQFLKITILLRIATKQSFVEDVVLLLISPPSPWD